MRTARYASSPCRPCWLFLTLLASLPAAGQQLAYEILAPFAIGRLVHPLTTVDDGWTYRDDFHPDDTDLAADLAQTDFLDLTRPLIPQMWRGGFSKAFYLEQVHQPRHLPYSARLFPYAWLEVRRRPLVHPPRAEGANTRWCLSLAGLHAHAVVLCAEVRRVD